MFLKAPTGEFDQPVLKFSSQRQNCRKNNKVRAEGNARGAPQGQAKERRQQSNISAQEKEAL